ncbi:MAG: alpha/beta fold hydrolase [Dehalococcoidia bacterium]
MTIRRAAGLLGAALASMAALALAACGDASSPATPSPAAIATAESASRVVRIDAPFSTTPEAEDEEQDPIVLSSRVFGSGPVGVILAHTRLDDQTSWFPFAKELADTGEYTVLTFDFRGFVDSTGEKRFDRLDTDLEAALAYVRDTLGIEKVFLVGASTGGTASLMVASQQEVAGVVSISAPGQFPPYEPVEAVGAIAAPKLFVTSADDVPQARSQEEFWEAAREPKEQHIYEGDAHGMDLFAGPYGADLRARVLAFLAAH